MLPRYHILFGAIFAFIFWIMTKTSMINLALVFLASILIDFDHYIASMAKTREVGLFKSFDYHNKKAIEYEKNHKKGSRNKGDFHIFHTIEFHIIIAIIGLFFAPFFFIFIGMTFHSALDIFSMVKSDRLYLREFFFSSWARKRMLAVM